MTDTHTEPELQTTATFLRDVNPDHNGQMKLYRVDPPVRVSEWDDENLEKTEYVVVSAANTYSGPETFIFPSDADGNVTHWVEIAGSSRGDLDHARAIARSGWVLR